MSKFEWQSIIKTNIFILRVVGLWPEGTEGYKLNLYTLYSLCMNLLVDGSNFFQSAYIFVIYADLQALAAIIFVIFTDWLASVKVLYFVRNTAILKQQMTELESALFQPRTKQQNLLGPGIKSWRLIYGSFSVLVVGTLLLWTFFPILDGTVKEHRLPFWAWYPYDAHTAPLYQITYLYQVVSIWFLAIANVNMDTLIAALMVFTATQCDILCDNLKHLRGEDFNERLLQCIEHHKKIVRYGGFYLEVSVMADILYFRFASNCNRFFNEIALGQFFTSSASLALAMFQLTLVAPLSSECYSLLFYVGSMTTQIFLYCWFGNEVEVRVSA
ncbi:hypothetical protein GEV33_001116 [Tenebrio molitor]|uniref:Odorant receptor n=1 Tax=Tenebrio molitor TaxID=7067 RepID=A0A8J6LH16_TENMO|nr:hypothetical protein GEV33_001116 [Tenebrio molitor]